jgi:hypothetical protein
MERGYKNGYSLLGDLPSDLASSLPRNPGVHTFQETCFSAPGADSPHFSAPGLNSSLQDRQVFDKATTRPCVVDLCRDSTEAGSNLLKLSVTDGFFWRSEIPLVTVIGPLSAPRPLPYRPLPDKDFTSTSELPCAHEL